MPPATTNVADDAFLRGHIALFFFAHRALAEAADAVLKKHRFGRAHHRAMFFTGRSPGITVMELLAVLRVTNQGITRVMNDLVANGMIERRVDENDGRVRRLFLTTAGAALVAQCSRAQMKVLRRAFEGHPPEALQVMTDIVSALMTEPERTANQRFLPERLTLSKS